MKEGTKKSPVKKSTEKCREPNMRLRCSPLESLSSTGTIVHPKIANKIFLVDKILLREKAFLDQESNLETMGKRRMAGA